MMFPNVFDTLRENANVRAMVGDRIARHGEIQQDRSRPYITWQIVLGQPFDNLSSAPCGDRTTVQIDCYHPKDKDAANLAGYARAALDAKLIVNRVIVDVRDPDTKLYRVGLEADFITNR